MNIRSAIHVSYSRYHRSRGQRISAADSPSSDNDIHDTRGSQTADCGDGDMITYANPVRIWPPNPKDRDPTTIATDGDGDDVTLASTGAHDEFTESGMKAPATHRRPPMSPLRRPWTAAPAAPQPRTRSAANAPAAATGAPTPSRALDLRQRHQELQRDVSPPRCPRHAQQKQLNRA